MRIVCAWCNKVIGGRGSVLSHGICRACFADLFQPQFGFMSSVPPLPAAHRQVRRGACRRVTSSSEPEREPALFQFP